MRTNRNGVTEVAHLRTDLKNLHENWDRIDWGKKDSKDSIKEEPKRGIMKLQITCFETIGGNHYTVIEAPQGMPNELIELGGNKVLEVSEEEGKAILQRFMDGVKLQVELALIHSKK